MDLHQRIEAIRLKIRANAQNAGNIEGLLTRPVQQYLSCLEIRHQDLEDLFRQDDAFWTKNLQKAQTTSQEIQQQLQAILERSQQEMQALMMLQTQGISAAAQRSNRVIRRMPMWGQKVEENAINFSWPTQEIIDELPPDVSLMTLDLQKAKGVWYFSSVRCILSNHLASPLFQNPQ